MHKFSQPTLFGKRLKKEPFFGADCPDTEYYRVINALWKTNSLDLETDRKKFLIGAQQEWNLIYKEDADARKSLMERASVASSDTQLLDSFVKHIPPPDSARAASSATSSPAASPSSTGSSTLN